MRSSRAVRRVLQVRRCYWCAETFESLGPALYCSKTHQKKAAERRATITPSACPTPEKNGYTSIHWAAYVGLQRPVLPALFLYRCREGCGAWHLTSHPGADAQPLRRDSEMSA